MNVQTLVALLIVTVCGLLTAGTEAVELSETFCVAWDKKCPLHDMTKKPKRIKKFERCLKKCAGRKKKCFGADYWEQDGIPQCQFKTAACTVDQLVDAAGARSFVRLPLGETTCPPGLVPSDAEKPAPTEAPTAAPTQAPTAPPPVPTRDPCKFAYDKCTCKTALKEVGTTDIKEGKIFQLESTCGRYKFRNFPLGAKACRDVGGEIATGQQLVEAQKAGGAHCSCGWLNGGTAAFPMQKSKSKKCGKSNQVNVCQPKMRGRKDGPGWNVWCVRKQ